MGEEAPTITPNTKLLEDPRTLTVTLDGVRWPIPKLAPKQNHIVVPLILRTLPRIMKTMQAAPTADQPDTAQKQQKVELNLQLLSEVLDEQGMDDLSTILFHALERGHPDLTRGAFDNMAIGTLDMIEAVMVIARQTGVIRQQTAGDRKVGEPQAA